MTTTSIRERALAVLPELKKLIFADEPAAPAEAETKVEAAKVTLVDGTEVIVTPALEQGATAMVVGPDGAEIAAPDGEHEAQDGTIFKVEGGVITEVKPIEDKPAEPAAPDMAAQMAEMKAELAAVKAEAESLKAQFAAQVEASKQMFNVVSILAGSPAESETEQKKKAFAKADPNDIATKLAVALSKLNPTN